MTAQVPFETVAVDGDRRFWWVPLPRWVVWGALLGIVITVVRGLAGEGWDPAWVAALAVAVGAFVGLPHCLVWLSLPCRTRYVVHHGRLEAVRGRHVLATYACDDIADIVVANGTGLSWRRLLFGPWWAYMGGTMPASRVLISARTRWDPREGEHRLPTLMIWGAANAQRPPRNSGPPSHGSRLRFHPPTTTLRTREGLSHADTSCGPQGSRWLNGAPQGNPGCEDVVDRSTGRSQRDRLPLRVLGLDGP